MQSMHRLTIPVFCYHISNALPLHVATKGDFVTENGMVFQVGGRSKPARQIQGQERAFQALDDIETGVDARIPLWLFGFLY